MNFLLLSSSSVRSVLSAQKLGRSCSPVPYQFAGGEKKAREKIPMENNFTDEWWWQAGKKLNSNERIFLQDEVVVWVSRISFSSHSFLNVYIVSKQCKASTRERCLIKHCSPSAQPSFVSHPCDQQKRNINFTTQMDSGGFPFIPLKNFLLNGQCWQFMKVISMKFINFSTVVERSAWMAMTMATWNAREINFPHFRWGEERSWNK